MQSRLNFYSIILSKSDSQVLLFLILNIVLVIIIQHFFCPYNIFLFLIFTNYVCFIFHSYNALDNIFLLSKVLFKMF